MLDNASQKILKFLENNGETKFETLYNKFGDNTEDILMALCNIGYAKQLINHPTFNSNELTYKIMPLGKAYFKERRISKIHFWIPIIIDTILSIAAIIISIIALAK